MIAGEKPHITGVLQSWVWWAVVSRFLLHGLIVGTWISRIPAIKESLRLGDGALGTALLGVAAGSLTAIPVTGWLVARFGSRPVTAWSTAGFAMSLVMPALAWDGLSLFASLVVFGAMAGCNDVAMNAHAVAVERSLGTLTMSRFHAMFSIGGMIGSAAGGAVATAYAGVRVHFAGAAALFLLIGSATAPLMMRTAPDRQALAAHAMLRHIPRALLVLSAIGFCIFLAEGAMADWTAVYLRQELGAAPGMAAAGYAVFSASMAVFRLLGDAITERVGAAWTIRGGGLLAAAGLAWALLVESPLWAMPGFALAGAGFSSIIPLVFAAGGRIPSIGEGPGVATVSGVGYLGFVVGPPAIGWVSEWTNLRGGLLVVVGLSALAAALVGTIDRRAGILSR